jgi:hypothetical protein
MADDQIIISALYDAIEADPSNVDYHERLIEFLGAKGNAGL